MNMKKRVLVGVAAAAMTATAAFGANAPANASSSNYWYTVRTTAPNTNGHFGMKVNFHCVNNRVASYNWVATSHYRANYWWGYRSWTYSSNTGGFHACHHTYVGVRYHYISKPNANALSLGYVGTNTYAWMWVE